MIVNADEFYQILESIEDNAESILDILNEEFPEHIGEYDDFIFTTKFLTNEIINLEMSTLDVNFNPPRNMMFGLAHINMDHDFEVSESHENIFNVILREHRLLTRDEALEVL